MKNGILFGTVPKKYILYKYVYKVYFYQIKCMYRINNEELFETTETIISKK